MGDGKKTYKLNDLQLMSLYRMRCAILDFFELARLSDYFVWDTASTLKLIPGYLIEKIMPTRARPDSETFRRVDSTELCTWGEDYVYNVFEKERMFLESTPVFEPIADIVESYVKNFTKKRKANLPSDGETEHVRVDHYEEEMPDKANAAIAVLNGIVRRCVIE